MCKEENVKDGFVPRLFGMRISIGAVIVFILGTRLFLSLLGVAGIIATVDSEIKKMEIKLDEEYGKDSSSASKDTTNWVLRFYSSATLLIPNHVAFLPLPGKLKDNEIAKVESLINDNKASLDLIDKAGKRNWCLSTADIETINNESSTSWYGFISAHSKGALRYLFRLLRLRTIIAARKGQTEIATNSMTSSLRFCEFPSSRKLLIGEGESQLEIHRNLSTLNKLLKDEVPFTDNQLKRLFYTCRSRNPIDTLGRSLTGECKFSLSYMKDILNGKKAKKGTEIQNWYSTKTITTRILVWFLKPLLALDIRFYLKTMESMMELTYKTKDANGLVKDMEFVEPEIASYYPLSSMAIPNIKGVLHGAITSKIRNDFAMIRIAAARANLKTGKYPESFKDISLDLLPAENRIDPFTGQQYEWTGQGPKFRLKSKGKIFPGTSINIAG